MPPIQASTQAETSSTYPFSPRELQRLAVYRAAVIAHFYTDQCDPIDPTEWTRSFDKVTTIRSQPVAN